MVQITKCGTYRGTTFVVSADLSPDVLNVNSYECLYFENAASAQLDCNNHEALGIYLSSVNSFSIHNCGLHGNRRNNVGLLSNLEVYESSGVNIDNVDITGDFAKFASVQQGSLTNSRMRNGIFEVDSSSGVVISGDTFTSDGRAFLIANQSLLSFFGGSGNQAVQNSLDGGWSKNNSAGGAGNGILIGSGGQNLGMESNITVRSNTIQNISGFGIVCNAGAPTDSVFQDNAIANVGRAQIFNCG